MVISMERVRKETARCLNCGSIYHVMREEGKCPTRGPRNKTILGGTEFKLLEIGVALTSCVAPKSP